MRITKSAIAGTLESSDCQITLEPGPGRIEFSLTSSVINQYGNEIRRVVYETLDRLGIDDVKVTMVDKGALNCTIKARVEGAAQRSLGIFEEIPWGGAIQ